MPDTLLGGIAINEFLVDPNGATHNFDTDGNGSATGGDEFVELINFSGSAIDISGLELWDQGRDNWFTFPPGTILQAGAVAVVVRDVQPGGSLPPVTGNNLAFNANYGSNVLNNPGDNVVIYDPSNDQYIQATYNGDPLLDPTTASGFSGFSSTATRSGSGENFGNDIDGISLQRLGAGFTNSATPTPGSLICFAEGTLIETASGFRAVENLRAGELVQTLDSGLQPIAWVFSTLVAPEDMDSHPNLRPIRLRPVNGHPPLCVSRQHRVLVSGKIVARMFGCDAVLIPAKDILDTADATCLLPSEPVRYFHILLEAHHILNANGYAAESLLPGDEALKTLEELAQNKIDAPSDALCSGLRLIAAAPARLLVAGAKARKLAFRKTKNGQGTVSLFAGARNWLALQDAACL
ncbi:MAG: Hint domain-containing protein [Marivita sp.]|uniref:Hint domain-containing protein n=1 Tax=Marivita sp. TaxID=2003365 RepID=UPI003EF35A8C